MLIRVCLRILASSGIPRYDLGRQTLHFLGGSVTPIASALLLSSTQIVGGGTLTAGDDTLAIGGGTLTVDTTP
jgi:hypothetical protein